MQINDFHLNTNERNGLIKVYNIYNGIILFTNRTLTSHKQCSI